MRGGEIVVLCIRQIGEVGEAYENESSLVDFANMEEEAESIVECIHQMAYRELLSRTLLSMWGWEIRTKHMFENNRLQYIRDIITLPLGKVNRLVGCGYTTRKEIYDVFCMYHLKLKHWAPDLHFSKMNYKF
jgi:hypothetical protein